ncbi:MAG: DeoR/GlpR family DNA-binding transcription regulator [Sedimentisphaerales bacterium]
MFHDEKLEKILELLQIQPYWKSIDIAQKLGISKSTVQRCLQELGDHGIAERIHGGIRRKEQSPLVPSSLDERITRDSDAKEHIAMGALELFPDNGYVYIDAGTTTLPLARALVGAKHKKCTIVTNDVSIAVVLARHQIEHILLTGRIHPVTQSLSGTASQNQLLDFHFNTCFMSADGIDSDGNITIALADEAMLKRLAIKNSDTRILLASSSKWNTRSNTLIVKMDAFDMWVTDSSSSPIKALCRHNDVKLIVSK